MKKAYLIFSLLVLLAGCKADDFENETNQRFYLNTKSTTVIPYQLVEISSNIEEFNQEDYIATLGPNNIPLVSNNKGNLIFLVPDLSPGTYEFILDIDGRRGILNFQVEVNNPDVETTVNEKAFEFFIASQNFSNGLLSQNILSPTTADRLTSANNMISDLTAKYISLSIEEKTKIAKFLNANPLFTDFFEEKNAKSNNQAGEFLCFIINSIRITYFSELFYSWNEIITPALILDSSTIMADDIIKVFTIVGIYTISTQLEASIEVIGRICPRPVTIDIYDSMDNTNNFILQNNEYSTFDFIVGTRRLIEEDINDPDAFISELVNQIIFLETNWEDFKRINPIVLNNSNWFSQWLSPSSNYLAVTSNIIPLQDSDLIIENDGNINYLTLEGIPNGVTYDMQIINGNTFNLKFQAEEESLPQTFQMSIKYGITPFEPISKNINITLE